MSEYKLIPKTLSPVTVDSLVKNLETIGVQPGMTLLVHSSLSELGWVCGGAVAVIQALETVLTEEGTLVMPTHTGDLSDPAEWLNPPVPEGWWETIRQTMPPFEPDLTPTRKMGTVAETFRKQNGVLRSNHPHVSFAAWGKQAAFVTDNHVLEYELGEGSPLARIYELGGYVLLLGVGHTNNTSLHLAEYRANYPSKSKSRQGCPMLVDGRRKWVWYQDIKLCTYDFQQIGSDFENKSGLVVHGTAGIGSAIMMPQRALVNFAVEWMEANR